MRNPSTPSRPHTTARTSPDAEGGMVPDSRRRSPGPRPLRKRRGAQLRLRGEGVSGALGIGRLRGSARSVRGVASGGRGPWQRSTLSREDTPIRTGHNVCGRRIVTRQPGGQLFPECDGARQRSLLPRRRHCAALHNTCHDLVPEGRQRGAAHGLRPRNLVDRTASGLVRGHRRGMVQALEVGVDL